MADKPTKIEGIQQVIAELRQLNKSSKKDMIREKEALERQERLATGQEEVVASNSDAVDATTDFRRRFIAGQAKQLLNKGKITAPDKDDKPATRGLQRKQIEIANKTFALFAKQAGNAAENAREGGGKGEGEKKKGMFSGMNIPKSAKKAAGMAAMGVGIGGFMSGLMMWSNIDAFKGAAFPEQMNNLVDGWNHIGRMNTKAMIAMGALLVGGGFLGLKAIPAGIGMTAVGAGFGGFMSGIMMAGDLTGFSGKVFAENAGDLTLAMNSLATISTGGIAALGIIAAGGIAMSMGKGGIGRATKAALGASLGGAALGGFMTGIGAAGDITKIDASVFAENAVTTVKGLKALETLDVKTLTVLGAIASAGAVMATSKKGLGTAAKAALGASIMGAGIGGFMTGIASTGDLTGFDGSAFASQAKNVAEGIGAFSGPQAVALAAMITAGAVLGPMGSLTAAAGMTALGAGIGGFFTAMTGITDLAGALGVDGTGLKMMMTNMTDGLATFNQIEGPNLGSVGLGLGALAVGLTALFAIKGATGLGDIVGDTLDGVKNLANIEMISGKKDIDTSGSGMDNLIASIISPMKKLAVLGTMSTDLDLAKKGIASVVGVLNSLSGLKLNRSDFEFAKIVDDFVQGAHGIDAAFNGGEYAKDGFNITVKHGIRDISALEYTAASDGIAALQHALVGRDDSANPRKNKNAVTNNYGGNTTNNNYYTISEAPSFTATSTAATRSGAR